MRRQRFCCSLRLLSSPSHCGKPPATANPPVTAALSYDHILTRIQKIFAELLGKPEADIDVTKPIESYGADELDIVEIIMAVEAEFGFEIPDSVIGEKQSDPARKALTIQKLARLIANSQP